tara:strand:- start:1265 stop:3889 length:2625 start_codon:yes stop_codon:yes gene_type:complete
VSPCLTKLIPELKETEKIKRLCEKTTYVGIDFGTSNTVVSVCGWDEEREDLVLQELDVDRLVGGTSTALIPTVIYLDGDRFIIGQNAKHRGSKSGKKGENYLSSFKMDLGHEAGPKYHQFLLVKGSAGNQRNHVRDQVAGFLDQLLGGGQKDELNETLKIDSPQKATEAFFRILRGFIERHCENLFPGRDIRYSVSIPACFGANQRRDYKTALGAAGIKVEDRFFIDEPNAAFLSWLSEEDDVRSKSESNILVFDFGAGTCDLSILNSRRDPDSGTLKLKNLSVSRFSALGGDDIDREIAARLLFPIVCQENDLEPSDFPPHVYTDHIEETLKGISEKLKIRVSRKLARENLSADQPISIQLDASKEISPPRRWWERLTGRESKTIHIPDEFSITVGEFEAFVQKFIDGQTIPKTLQDNSWKSFWRRLFHLQGEEQNIFDLIKDVLTKANLKSSDIDILLFVGGSSNLRPVQEALAEYFDNFDNVTDEWDPWESRYLVERVNPPEIIVPEDLQSHVSKGVALHAFLSYGLKANPITEILAEDIFLMVKGGEELILKAGTEIPATVTAGSLYKSANEQRKVEMPFLAGEKRRVVTKVTTKFPPKMTKEDEITLEASVDRHKIIHLSASYEGGKILANEEISPYAQESLDEYHQKVGQLTAELNTHLLKENFTVGEDSLWDSLWLSDNFPRSGKTFYKLVALHEQQSNHMACLSLYEQLAPDCYTNLGYYARKTGERDLAKKYSKKAYEANPNGVSAFNLALEYNKDPADYRKYMEEAVGFGYHAAKLDLGRLIKKEDPERSAKLIDEAAEYYRGLFAKNPEGLESWVYYYVEAIAKHFDDFELLQQVEKAKAKQKQAALEAAQEIKKNHLLRSAR